MTLAISSLNPTGCFQSPETGDVCLPISRAVQLQRRVGAKRGGHKIHKAKKRNPPFHSNKLLTRLLQYRCKIYKARRLISAELAVTGWNKALDPIHLRRL